MQRKTARPAAWPGCCFILQFICFLRERLMVRPAWSPRRPDSCRCRRHAGDGVVGHMGLDAGVGLDELVEAPDQGAAAGHADAVGGDIGHQLGRRALQHAVDGLQDAGGDLLEGLDHLAGGHREHPGQAGHEAAALDLHRLLLRAGEDAADLHLQLLRRPLTDEYIVLAPYVLHDGLVELVAGDLDGGGLHDAGQGDDRDVGGAAADVHDHVAVGLGDVDARAMAAATGSSIR